MSDNALQDRFCYGISHFFGMKEIILYKLVGYSPIRVLLCYVLIG